MIYYYVNFFGIRTICVNYYLSTSPMSERVGPRPTKYLFWISKIMKQILIVLMGKFGKISGNML
jgi:hypothetical protein